MVDSNDLRFEGALKLDSARLRTGLDAALIVAGANRIATPARRTLTLRPEACRRQLQPLSQIKRRESWTFVLL